MIKWPGKLPTGTLVPIGATFFPVGRGTSSTSFAPMASTPAHKTTPTTTALNFPLILQRLPANPKQAQGSLSLVRSPLIIALLGAACLAAGQASGTYQPASGQQVAWSIDLNHNLVWGGHPYIPVGVEIGASADAIAGAKKSGFQDCIVDMPPDGAGWKDTIGKLEAGGMRYILSIDGLFPSARGFAVEPEAYRIDNITGDRHVEFPLPGATSALAVLVTQRDGAVQSSARVAVADGKFSYNVATKTDLDEVLLVYPEQSEADQPDYWDGFD